MLVCRDFFNLNGECMFSFWRSDSKETKEQNPFDSEMGGLYCISAALNLAQAKKLYDDGDREGAIKSSLEAAELFTLLNMKNEAKDARNFVNKLDAEKNSYCRMC